MTKWFTIILFLFHFFKLFSSGSDSTKTISYKGFYVIGYNYDHYNHETYFYGKYRTFNSYLFSVSNGILIKNELFVGLKTDVEKLNETWFFPVGLEISPRLPTGKKDGWYIDLAAGYGFGKTDDKAYALNHYHSSSLTFHYCAGLLYDHPFNKSNGIIIKLYYDQHFYTTREVFGTPSSNYGYEKYVFNIRNIGFNIGLSF